MESPLEPVRGPVAGSEAVERGVIREERIGKKLRTQRLVLATQDWGLTPYSESLRRQAALVDDVLASRALPTLVFCEHPPVFTCGRDTKPGNILLSRQELSAKGIEVLDADRGGQVTFHNPGQLVGYVFIDLTTLPGARKGRKPDVRGFCSGLEKVVCAALKRIGFDAERSAKYRGLWRGERKLAAIGVNVKNGVTSHGFALNVDNDLAGFGFMRPCGLDFEATSVSKEAPSLAPLSHDVLKRAILEEFAAHFGFRLAGSARL